VSDASTLASTFGAHRLSQPRDERIAQESPMPIIKARTNRVRSVKHYCRLDEPNRDTLVLYARFIDDSENYVLNRLIETTLAKDREFLAWRAEQTADVASVAHRRASVGPRG
jgi:hypothetical protein